MTSLYRTSTTPLPYVEGGHTRQPKRPQSPDVRLAADVSNPDKDPSYSCRFDAYERILGLSAEVHRLEPFEARYNSLLAGIKNIRDTLHEDANPTMILGNHETLANMLGEAIDDAVSAIDERLTGEAVNVDLRPTIIPSELAYHLRTIIDLGPVGTGTAVEEGNKQRAIELAKKYLESL